MRPESEKMTVEKFKSALIVLYAEAREMSTRDQLAAYVFAYDLVEAALTRPKRKAGRPRKDVAFGEWRVLPALKDLSDL